MNWTLGQPLYHAGVRASFAIGDSSAALYVVNGWNEIEDSNTDKTLGFSITRPYGASSSVTVDFITGMEGTDNPTIGNPLSFGGIAFATPGRRHVDMLNSYASHTFLNGSQFILDANYGWATDASWYGAAGYYVAPVGGGSLTTRAEFFRDADGLKSGATQTFYSATLTYTKPITKNVESRLEFRHDRSTAQSFIAGSGMSDSRNTLTAGLIVRF